MTRFSRPCLVCGKLSKQTRCEQHQAELNLVRESKRDTPERRARKKALYGGDYRQRRAAALEGATTCYLCKETFKPSDRIEADHIIAGDPHSPLAPAHRLCNQRRGNKPLA